MKQTIKLVFLTLLFGCSKADSTVNFTQYVDPRIGTGGHGHVFMGANVPFGLVQLGPSNIPQAWDWTSGYHISDSTIIGFSHTHLSGTGIGDLGDINLMPATTSDVTLARGKAGGDYSTGFFSLFRRETEQVRPGYYAVHLDRYNVDVELTATRRVGFHKYTFPAGAEAKIILDLTNGQAWDKLTEASLTIESDTVISGYRYSKGWANNQKIYFTMVFSKPTQTVAPDTAQFTEGCPLNSALAGGLTGLTITSNNRLYFVPSFGNIENTPLYVKVALSPVSIDNAKMNMQAELPGWNFDQTAQLADKAWNEELGKIDITADERTKRIFYTALYHTMIAPSVFCDVNGDYRGADGKTYSDASFTNYTTFSLWDTYRAAHPLMTLIHPEKMPDIINTFLGIYKQQGKLPVWHLMGCETDCMVGNPGISVVADAIMKDFGGFDINAAYDAMKTSAMLDERGLKYLKEYGYIPYDKESEGLSKAMEYAIADWALAQVAQKLGKTDDYNYFLNRSKVYQHYFDKETGFVRGLSSEGKFRAEPLNPFHAKHRENDYTEGNAWQYTWLVPHDIDGLVQQFGSKEAFIAKLDSLFVAEGELGENASPDISGLIGQYAHGNEPSHHIIYMYPCVGQAWKTQEKVREVLSTMYSDQPDGLSGNEDVGQMSAWYILSAMGLYQVEPAGGKYVFGSPIVDKAILSVGNGKTFTIAAKNNSAKNKYVQKITLNGTPYDKFYIDFATLSAGGRLEFEMGEAPRKQE